MGRQNGFAQSLRFVMHLLSGSNLVDFHTARITL